MAPGATVFEAVRAMADHHVGAVPVIADGAIVGMFTERDLLNRVIAQGRDPQAVTLDQVMTPDPTSIRADRPLVEALDIMFASRFRHLPVVDAGGALVGVLSCRDVPVAYQTMRERWIEAREALRAAA
jgi:CBS domain-containing protein